MKSGNLRSTQCILHQHRDGHWANATRNGCQVTGDFLDLIIGHIPHQAISARQRGIIDTVDPHIDDHRAAILHAVLSGSLTGAINLSAPAAERNRNFGRKLAAALHRPAILPVPGFALRLALDGFGEVLLAGQHARPAALEADGFRFRFPTLESALADLLR